MRKFALCGLILVLSIPLYADHHDEGPNAVGIVVDGGHSTTVTEELHYKKVTTQHHKPDGIVIIPIAEPEVQDANPFGSYHYEKEFKDGELIFRTKKLTLKIAKEGVTVNGDFIQWKDEERSMGIFNSAETVDVEQLNNGFKVKVNWSRHVPPRYKDDILEVTVEQVTSTEDVEWSLLDPSGDVESNVMKLDSAHKLNNLISLINPFLKSPYNKRLYLQKNASYKEKIINQAVELAKQTYRGDARDDILKDFLLNNYAVGFNVDEVIELSNQTYRGDARDEILFMAAQCYLYFYEEEDIMKLSKHTYRGDARDKILKLLARRKAGVNPGHVIIRPDLDKEDLERSRYVSNLIQTARATSNSSSHNSILVDGFRSNLELNFSLTEVLKIARATTNSSSQNSVLFKAAEYYQERWSQEDFRILANATTNSSYQNSILKIASQQLIDKPQRKFYDDDFKQGHGSLGDYKHGYGPDERQYSQGGTSSKVKVDIQGADNAEVDIKITN